MLSIMALGDLEDLIRESTEPAPSRTVPPPPDARPDLVEIKRLKALVAEHGYELLM